MNQCTRRDFIAGATAIAGGAALGLTWPGAVWSKVSGANDDIRLAIVGLRKKGIEHLEMFPKVPGVRIVALCDADSQFLDLETKKFMDRNEKVATYVDYRKLLDDKEIDAVVIVTPDHWHALMTVWACQAGKDVYVEKPASYSIWEGRKMIEAARKYKCIMQVGSQNRSDVGLRAAIPYIRQGNLGRIRRARCFCYNPRESIGKVNGPQPVPRTLDYNLFMGPASLVPLTRRNLHYDWHWFWSTGTGEMGNIGAHNLDHCRWAINQSGLPQRVISIGGRFAFDDDGQTPNTHLTFFDYKPVPIVFEIRALPRSKGHPAMDSTFRDIRTSMVIECEDGFFAGGRGGGWVYDKDGRKIKQFPGDGGAGHQANFIKAMRSRKVSDLRTDILKGHISAALCHMANISYRLGRRESAEQIKNAIDENTLLAEAFERMLAHLKANEVDLISEPLTIGPMLTFDAEKEKFAGRCSDWANMLLKRNYREPFVVPEKV